MNLDLALFRRQLDIITSLRHDLVTNKILINDKEDILKWAIPQSIPNAERVLNHFILTYIKAFFPQAYLRLNRTFVSVRLSPEDSETLLATVFSPNANPLEPLSACHHFKDVSLKQISHYHISHRCQNSKVFFYIPISLNEMYVGSNDTCVVNEFLKVISDLAVDIHHIVDAYSRYKAAMIKLTSVEESVPESGGPVLHPINHGALPKPSTTPAAYPSVGDYAHLIEKDDIWDRKLTAYPINKPLPLGYNDLGLAKIERVNTVDNTMVIGSKIVHFNLQDWETTLEDVDLTEFPNGIYYDPTLDFGKPRYFVITNASVIPFGDLAQALNFAKAHPEFGFADLDLHFISDYKTIVKID